MTTEARTGRGAAPQKVDLLNGNEMAALAACHVNYHVMGYYPITPSTAVAEELDRMKAEGLHDVVMIPGDGEHGAAGICYGASVAGARVFNTTSANGLMYALEQLPVQSGTRFPMVMNIVNRSVSGPLDIRGDHSDIMFALNAGWIILMAKDPQMVYDLNIIAVRLGEHPDVRLPVIVSFDGFFTSHQQRRVHYFTDRKPVQDFIGPVSHLYDVLDTKKPITIGAYMNDPDLINNKKQLSIAMENAYGVAQSVFDEYALISGRRYTLVETYRLEDAEAALVLLNSAYETAKEAVDEMRAEGKKVGLATVHMLRPFPVRELQEALRGVKAVCVGDRQESYGGWGGNMTIELKAALKDDPRNGSLVFSRIYGLGGKEFFIADAREMLRQAVEAAESGKVALSIEYVGANPGDPHYTPAPAAPPLTARDAATGITVEKEDGKLRVKGLNPRELTRMPKRIAPGHGACPGCGIFPSLNNFLRGVSGYVIVLFHTGCGMVTTTSYPYSSHRMTYIHNLFQNGAATLSGTVESYIERKRRGEIPPDEEITFIMVTGDGGNDIGMGPTIGAAMRCHNMIILEYDNEGYMNTGNQLSFTTPLGHATSTSHVGPFQHGKKHHHKDTPQIMAACHIPYVFTAVESRHVDLTRKAAKAQWYAKHEGPVYAKILSACPLNWRSKEQDCSSIIQAAVDSCFFPLYEIEHGITTINYDPEEKGNRIPVIEWLKTMGKTRHFMKAEFKEDLEKFEAEVERRWRRLKAMHENPVL
ncbi:MAG: thiamine pyrophosphate-dependent enzyme [bacterium]